MKRLLAILLLAAFTATGAQTLTNIFTGTTVNDGTGDSNPLAFKKSNTNDWYLYDLIGSTSNGVIDFTLTVQSNLQSQIDSMQSPTNGVTAEFMTNSIQAIAGQYTNDLNANLLPLIYSRAATNDADIWSSRIRGASVYNALRMQTDSSFYVTPSVYFTNVGGDLYLMHTNLGRVFAVSNGIVAGNGALITNIPQAGVTGLPEALAWLTNNSGTSGSYVTTNDNRNLVFQTGRWSLTNASDVPIVAMFSTNSGYRYQSPLSDIIYRWDATGPAWRSQVNASGGSGGSLKLYSAAGVERISLNGADGGGVTLGADHPITFGETPYQIGTLAADSLVYDSWSKHVFRYGTHGAEATALTLEGNNATLAGWIQASEFRGTLRRQDITNGLTGTITNNTTGNAATATAATTATYPTVASLTNTIPLGNIEQGTATLGKFAKFWSSGWIPADIYPEDLGQSTAGSNQVIRWSGSSWEASDDVLLALGATATAGDFPRWSGTAYTNSHTIFLSELAAGGASDADVMVYNPGAGGWVPTALDLDYLSQSGATTNQVPKWNGANWVPSDDATSGEISIVTAEDSSITVTPVQVSPGVTNFQVRANVTGTSSVAYDGQTVGVQTNTVFSIALTDGHQMIFNVAITGVKNDDTLVHYWSERATVKRTGSSISRHQIPDGYTYSIGNTELALESGSVKFKVIGDLGDTIDWRGIITYHAP